MKKKYLDLFLIVLFFVISLIYMYYLRPLMDDEIFNYGFANNILNGQIPYKDFNMIILPFFSYLLAIFLAVMGKKLIVYHLVISGIITFITYFSYKRVGFRAIVIFLLLLVYPYTGYNIFCLFLLMVLFWIKDRNNDVLEAIIIGMMFLTKQTLAILIIPSIIFAKNKRKVIIIYLIIGLSFLVYLLINDNLYQCLDYCFFGMFDFTSKNNTGTKGYLMLEIVILISLIYLVIKTKRKDYAYLLFFQIIVFPIVDYIHFVIGLIPVVYCLLFRFKKNFLFNVYAFGSVITFFGLLNYGILTTDGNYLFLYHYDVDGFMKGRYTLDITKTYIDNVRDNLEKYKDYTPYILSDYSYLIKLNLGLRINKYDIINYGNMGYRGGEKYIREIDDYCSQNKCVIFINVEELYTEKIIQTDRNILRYVTNNYIRVDSSSVIKTYVNKM